MNNKKEIANLFSSAIEHLNKTNSNRKEMQVYLKENADYQLKSGNYAGAVETLESLRKAKPNDHKILSQLINTYSKFDADKAKL